MGDIISVENLVSLIDAEMNHSFDLGLAQFFSELNINLSKQIKRLEYEMMRYVYEQTGSRSKIQIITGLSRHKIHKFVQSYSIDKALKKQKTKSKVFAIFISELKKCAEKYPNSEIPIYGKRNSFNAIFNESTFQNGMITAKTMLESLENSGCIKISGKSIRFVSAFPKRANTTRDVVRQFSDVIYRLSHTQLHNKNISEPEESRYQMTVRSTSIPPEKHQEVIHEIRKKLRQCSKEIFDLLEQNEASTKQARQNIEALELEVGVTQFIFLNKRGDI